MRVMVMVKSTKVSESGALPDPESMAAMGKFNEELVKSGAMLAGEGLHPSSKGVRVRFSGTERTVEQGPFAATNELVSGFWIWKVASMEEAVEWVKKCPNPFAVDSEIEIRRVYEMEEFSEAMTPEVKEQETRLRKQLEG